MAFVLKSKTEKNPRFSGVAGFNLDDFAKRATEDLEQSQAMGRALVEEAEKEAETIRNQAIEEGRAEGLQNADEVIDQRVKVAVDAAVRSRIGALEGTVEQLWNQEVQWLDDWKQQTLQLAMHIAQRLTQDAVQGKPEIILRWAEEALEQMRAARVVYVAVHPETLGLLGTQLDALVRKSGLPAEVHIVPDENVEVMGVVVRQEGGEIDMQLQSQLDQIQRQCE